MTVAYLGLGTNLGDREENLRRAVDTIAKKFRGCKQSSVD